MDNDIVHKVIPVYIDIADYIHKNPTVGKDIACEYREVDSNEIIWISRNKKDITCPECLKSKTKFRTVQ